MTISRVCDADIESVFRAWIDPGIMRRWWTPNPDWKVGEIKVVARLGGSFSVEFAPDGEESFIEKGTYIEFDSPNRIVYTEHVIRGDKTMHGPAPCRVDFRAIGPSTTEVTVTSTLEPGEGPDARTQGWSAALDLLVEIMTSR